jgi:hypothetical protein
MIPIPTGWRRLPALVKCGSITAPTSVQGTDGLYALQTLLPLALPPVAGKSPARRCGCRSSGQRVWLLDLSAVDHHGCFTMQYCLPMHPLADACSL